LPRNARNQRRVRHQFLPLAIRKKNSEKQILRFAQDDMSF
jgi:hypothetical protein